MTRFGVLPARWTLCAGAVVVLNGPDDLMRTWSSTRIRMKRA